MAYASQSSLRYWWSPACQGPHVRISLNGAGKVTVRPAAAQAVQALNKVLVAYRYVTRYADTGAYNCRKVTGGSTYSLHAYGIAIDINWQSNPYSRTLRTDMFIPGDHRMPYRIEAIRTKSGAQVWRWGGWFSGNKDAMHYEITCSPRDLATGINWNTVYGGGAAPAPAPPASTPTTAPTHPTGALMHRLCKFTVNGKTHVYRCIMGYNEWKRDYWPVMGWWVENSADLKIWQTRGLLLETTSRPLTPSVFLVDGPIDNTNTNEL